MSTLDLELDRVFGPNFIQLKRGGKRRDRVSSLSRGKIKPDECLGDRRNEQTENLEVLASCGLKRQSYIIHRSSSFVPSETGGTGMVSFARRIKT